MFDSQPEAVLVPVEKVGAAEFVAWPGDLPPVTAPTRAGAMAAARTAFHKTGAVDQALTFGIVQRD